MENFWSKFSFILSRFLRILLYLSFLLGIIKNISAGTPFTFASGYSSNSTNFSKGFGYCLQRWSIKKPCWCHRQLNYFKEWQLRNSQNVYIFPIEDLNANYVRKVSYDFLYFKEVEPVGELSVLFC